MHRVWKTLAPFAVMVLLQSLVCTAAIDKTGEMRLTFDAKPAKERFAHREPVQFRFRLQNVGTKEVLVFKRLTLYFSVHLKITGPDGKPALRCGPIPLLLWKEEDFKVLRPGEKLENQETISCQGEQGPPEDRWGYAISTPGKYTVQPEYRVVIGDSWIQTKDGNQVPFFRGGVTCPTVEFTIEGPRGSLAPPAPSRHAQPADERPYWAFSPLLTWLSLGVVLALSVLYVALRNNRA